jgi:hypothetical protein
MNGGIFVIKEDDQLVEMTEQSYDSEDLLQELLAKYPNLLAGDQINIDSPRRWLLVSREINVPDSEDSYGRFSLDHLFLDQDGIPTLVEVKRSSDTRIRREVVGQMLDYAANAVVYWPIEVIIAKFEATIENTEREPDEVLEKFLDTEADPEDFWQKVKTNLTAGKIRMVFVADKIPSELRRVVEFLNEQMDPAEVLAIEVKQYTGENLKTLVPRVIGQTQEAIQKKGGVLSGRQWDEISFFEHIAKKQGSLEADIARKIFEWAKNTASGIWWGKGKVTGAFVPTYDTHQGIHYQLFAVFTNGTIQIYFQTYSKRPVFQDEEKRLELLKRLNSIPGVSLSEDAISRYPSIPMNVFQDLTNLNKFFEIYEWFIESITNS